MKTTIRISGDRLALKVPPLALGLIVAALMWLAAWLAPFFDFSFPAHSAAAVILALIGSAICISGVTSFRRAKTTVNPVKPGSASALVISGIYRFTRNPMYLGFALILFGWAMFLANALALALIPAFVVYMNRFQIGPEEHALASLFANQYAAYAARFRRWI